MTTRLLRKIICALVLTLSFVGFPEHANAVPEFRVAYVDLQKALAESKAGKKAQVGYEKEVKQAQAKIDKKKGKFEQLKKKFTAQKDSLSEQSMREKEEELIALEKDIKRSFKDSQENLRRKNAMIVSDLVNEIRKVVNNVGKKKEFTIILEKSAQAVLYADSSIDITNEVVQQFDQAK